jgi:hypothetical protein
VGDTARKASRERQADTRPLFQRRLLAHTKARSFSFESLSQSMALVTRSSGTVFS